MARIILSNLQYTSNLIELSLAQQQVRGGDVSPRYLNGIVKGQNPYDNKKQFDRDLAAYESGYYDLKVYDDEYNTYFDFLLGGIPAVQYVYSKAG